VKEAGSRKEEESGRKMVYALYDFWGGRGGGRLERPLERLENDIRAINEAALRYIWKDLI
jgi:hypothetical protein